MIRQIEYIHGTGRRAGSQIPKDIICALNVDQGLITGRITKSFRKENIAELAGIHGDPAIAHPVEVDVLTIDTTERAIAIEAFNRGALLFSKSTDEILRLHRFLCTLESELVR